MASVSAPSFKRNESVLTPGLGATMGPKEFLKALDLDTLLGLPPTHLMATMKRLETHVPRHSKMCALWFGSSQHHPQSLLM